MMRLIRNKKGQGLVEYGLIIAGVALICAAAVSIFGHKTNDLIAGVAAILPGAHGDDNQPIRSGHLIETDAVNGSLTLDFTTISANSDGTHSRLSEGITGGNSASLGGLLTD